MTNLKSQKLKEISHKDNLDEAMRELQELECMERVGAELSRPLLSEIEYYKKDTEINELYNLQLTLKEINKTRNEKITD